MSIIVWKESYEVGVRRIDDDHKKMAALINKMQGCLSGKGFQEEASNIIDELVRYSVGHFEYEEKLMAEHNYPALEEHRGEHIRFCEFIADVSYGSIYNPMDLESLVKYLRRWFVNHILRDDMKYKPYLPG